MKRLLKVLTLLVVSLFALVSGVDVTLDRMSHTVTQSAFTCYNQKEQVVATYDGDLTLCQTYPKPPPAVAPGTIRPASFTPPSVD